ncbi:MAG: hypothetical protein SFW09_12750 [Hyphomicrobiaceae bacterium]|nr:hypothetical protein [Hyphomicrobiaceae bacterium]
MQADASRGNRCNRGEIGAQSSDPDLPAPMLPGPEEASREYIEFLADMIQELCALSRRVGSPTLSGLLELAHHQAELDARRR